MPPERIDQITWLALTNPKAREKLIRETEANSLTEAARKLIINSTLANEVIEAFETDNLDRS